jgi:hypothetical protein
MADFGRVSSSVAEPAVTLPAGEAVGRISSSVAEAAVTLPTGDAVGRISSSLAEAAVTLPAGDAVGRISSCLGEAAVLEVGDEARVAFVLVTVFSRSPGVAIPRPALVGGPQGQRVSDLKRSRRR